MAYAPRALDRSERVEVRPRRSERIGERRARYLRERLLGTARFAARDDVGAGVWHRGPRQLDCLANGGGHEDRCLEVGPAAAASEENEGKPDKPSHARLNTTDTFENEGRRSDGRAGHGETQPPPSRRDHNPSHNHPSETGVDGPRLPQTLSPRLFSLSDGKSALRMLWDQ